MASRGRFVKFTPTYMGTYKQVHRVIESLPGEEWRSVAGYEGQYSVSNLGRVASHVWGPWANQNKILKPGLKANGYLKVSLGGRASPKNFHIHRLVLLNFVGNPDRKTDVNHKDGNKLNNRLDNLEWATRSENMRHAMRTGLWSSVGARNPQAKLAPADVIAIRTLYSRERRNSKELSQRFGVSQSTINDAVSGRKWRHVA